IVRLEPGNGAAGRDDRVHLRVAGWHIALMGLVRAIYIEKLEPGPLRWARPAAHHVVDHPPIDDVLAPTIGIERAQRSECRGALVISEAGAAVTVGRGAGSIDTAGRTGGTLLAGSRG